LGILDKNHWHIGNIRLLKIDPIKISVEVGFINGKYKFREIDFTEELFLATAMWLKSIFQIRTVNLGEYPCNVPALKLHKNRFCKDCCSKSIK
jgi:hypothetical protein